jgi:hypothetical protein
VPGIGPRDGARKRGNSEFFSDTTYTTQTWWQLNHENAGFRVRLKLLDAMVDMSPEASSDLIGRLKAGAAVIRLRFVGRKTLSRRISGFPVAAVHAEPSQVLWRRFSTGGS